MRKREKERNARTAAQLFELGAALKLIAGMAGEHYEGEGIDIIKKNAKKWSRTTGHAYVKMSELK